MMGFFGSIRYIKQRSWLQALFKLFYTEGSLNAMLHGK